MSKSLAKGLIGEPDLRLANLSSLGESAYVSLSSDTAVKRLEQDYIYQIGCDELYEINAEALDFISKCDGSETVTDLSPDSDFLQFCSSEGILDFTRTPFKKSIAVGKAPSPSLRYLEWLVTYRCNLTCAHCYLVDENSEEFSPELIHPLLKEFSEMQGLRVLVSGGEPTLYKHFELLNEALPEYPFRVVLLTNGSNLNRAMVSRLNFHEIQISLDGMEEGHDAIRGKGAFRKATRGMELVREAEIDLSVATMVHRLNLDEWDSMKDLMESLGAREWNVDYPCSKGRWTRHAELSVPFDIVAEKMRYAFGGSYHGTSPGWTCGRHLTAVTPSGDVCRCGLFPEVRLGSVRTGLAEAWSRVNHIPIAETACSGCRHEDACGGGCRFRAESINGKDKVMCAFHKIGT